MGPLPSDSWKEAALHVYMALDRVDTLSDMLRPSTAADYRQYHECVVGHCEEVLSEPGNSPFSDEKDDDDPDNSEYWKGIARNMSQNALDIVALFPALCPTRLDDYKYYYRLVTALHQERFQYFSNMFPDGASVSEVNLPSR